MTVDEDWRGIPGLEGRYEASNLGRVRSIDRVEYSLWGGQKVRRRLRGRVLKPASLPKSGHLHVTLGRGDRSYVHRLVALAFFGNPPEGTEVRHIDGNPKNNRIENIEYASRSVNTLDRKYHSPPSTAKLSPDDVTQILQNLETRSGRDVARQFSVSASLISSIKNGQVHRDIWIEHKKGQAA